MNVLVFIIGIGCLASLCVAVTVTMALTCGPVWDAKGRMLKKRGWSWIHTCGIGMAVLLFLWTAVTYVGITRSGYEVIESEPLVAIKDDKCYNVEDIDGATRLIVFLSRGDKYIYVDVSDPLFREHIEEDEEPRIETRVYKFVGMRLEKKIVCVNLPEEIEHEFGKT